MFSAFRTFGRMGAPAGRTLAQQIAAMSPSLWLEPSVTSGYQDSAGTTALTQPGGGSADPPVGLALDLSGLGNHALQATSTARPKLSARVNLLVGTATLATQSVTVTAAAHTIEWSGAGTITASGAYSGALTSGQTFTPSAGTLTLTVSGSVTSASLVLGSSVGTYQAVTDANTYDYSGFPLYWKFDGTDDALATGNIDLTGTDKVTVVVATDPSQNASVYSGIVGNGNVNNTSGAFALFNGITGFLMVSSHVRQTSTVAKTSAVVSQRFIATTSFNTSTGTGSSVSLRINGVDQGASGNAGVGMMANAPIYISNGSALGGSGYRAGNIYALLIFPRLLTAAEIAIVERYVAQKVGVTL